MDCVFCKILKGEIPAAKIAENDKAIAILDINPANYGHALVIPKNHVERLYELDEATTSAVMELVKEVMKREITNLGAEGVNILHNHGQVAGQIVPHVHIHVIPRYKDDKVVALYYERKQYDEAKMKEIFEKMSKPAQQEQNQSSDLDIDFSI